MKQEYKWKRFWCPRDADIALADGGYLPDPESEYGKIYNPELKTLPELSDKQCLILLGEPGIGKTTALTDEIKSLNATALSQGAFVHPLTDLRSFSDENRLITELFKNQTFNDWLKTDQRLFLFLDGLDECLLRITHLSSLLSG